ncbi:MAG: hypothetical protein E3J72_00040 [Planctomycetota bacterium]|nr:MAG: hypothetical protein E3J72_00040 [Planctomycetota bacterium]
MELKCLPLLISVVMLASCNTNAVCPKDQEKKTASMNNDIDRLKSSDYDERERAAGSLIERRTKTISDLLEIAKLSDNNNSSKEVFGRWEAAIFLLGELRAEEAVKFLVDNIGFTTPGSLMEDDSEYDGLPSVEALIKIGIPSTERIWANIGMDRLDKKTIQLYVLVLRYIYDAYDQKDLRVLIESRLKKESSDDEKANLKELLGNIGFRR